VVDSFALCGIEVAGHRVQVAVLYSKTARRSPLLSLAGRSADELAREGGEVRLDPVDAPARQEHRLLPQPNP
jgi:hypothetical protein